TASGGISAAFGTAKRAYLSSQFGVGPVNPSRLPRDKTALPGNPGTAAKNNRLAWSQFRSMCPQNEARYPLKTGGWDDPITKIRLFCLLFRRCTLCTPARNVSAPTSERSYNAEAQLERERSFPSGTA